MQPDVAEKPKKVFLIKLNLKNQSNSTIGRALALYVVKLGSVPGIPYGTPRILIAKPEIT